jgi:magnesium chelatase family protein
VVAVAHTFTIDGARARAVTVEIDVRPGLPSFTIVGLASTAVREARERIRTAIVNCDMQMPAKRVTVSLAPADLPKSGAGLDLPIACAILAASGQVPTEALRESALYGELALDGSVRGARGALAVAIAARGSAKRLLLAHCQAAEAMLVEGISIDPVASLASALRVLRGGAPDLAAPPGSPPPPPLALDLAEVRGREHAIEALVLAAAGGHNLLLAGAPGTGKTMLATRMPSILPALSPSEALEVASIHNLTDAALSRLPSRRPFRAPHHTTSAAGLVGGARNGWIGEAALAHRGVLFLDELCEFDRGALESLRQPLEDHLISLTRAAHVETLPAQFVLLAATNPCPCGYAGSSRKCRCSAAELARYERRMSGPLMDRIDLSVSLHEEPGGAGGRPSISSARARERVRGARERQRRRFRATGLELNSQLDGRLLAEHVRLDARGDSLLARAREEGMLSMRGERRMLTIARTLADLDARNSVGACDLARALALRSEHAPSRMTRI